MDPVNNPTTTQNQNPDMIVAVDADVTIDNAFADIIGVAELSESPDAVYHYFVASPMYSGFGDLNSPERVLFLDGIYKMSPNLRNYLTSADTVEIIFSIGKEYNMEDAQISRLSTLVRDLLIGKIFIKDFPTTISSKLGIDDIKAGEIANKIITKSFGPIIEDVKRIQRSKFPDKISQIQKESQPAGLTQPTARPDNPQIAKPDSPPQTAPQPAQSAPITSVPPPPTPQQSQGVVRPPLPPVQTVRPPPLPSQPIQQAPPPAQQPNQQPRSTEPTRASAETLKPSPPKPMFKVPDLSGIQIPPSTPSGRAEESLEKELEKVASVIDLRNKPEN